MNQEGNKITKYAIQAIRMFQIIRASTVCIICGLLHGCIKSANRAIYSILPCNFRWSNVQVLQEQITDGTNTSPGKQQVAKYKGMTKMLHVATYQGDYVQFDTDQNPIVDNILHQLALLQPNLQGVHQLYTCQTFLKVWLMPAILSWENLNTHKL